MNYPVSTAQQLSAVLRGMRKARGLTQAQAGQLLGVNQKRAARIENTPGVTSFDQIARLVSALGGRIVIELKDAPPSKDADAHSKSESRRTKPPVGPSRDAW
jgi:HTH-type transcriptional regulator / antitoxin HipB